MKRRTLALMALAALLTISACSKKQPQQTPSEPQSAAPVVGPKPAPPLTSSAGQPAPLKQSELTRKTPAEFTPDSFATALAGYLNEEQADPAGTLMRLYERWQLLDGDGQSSLMAEGDLDQDGRPELVTAVGSLGGKTALFVVYVRDGQYRVDIAHAGNDAQPVRLHEVKDLTGDGQPEILFSETEMGAHTIYGHMLVGNWAPGKATMLPSAMEMSDMQWELDGRDVLLRGGTIGSAGAGVAQRPRTDRYRWVSGRFSLVDRQYSTARFGYHDLQDGIVAETYGRTADAEAAFQAALAPDRQALRAGMLSPELSAPFADAVRAMARLRLGALLLTDGRADAAQAMLSGGAGQFAGLTVAAEGAATRQAACDAAEAWVTANPDFLGAINAPEGYANPQWYGGDLCGALPIAN